MRDAGEYRVIFKVKDKLNYAFINGEDSISVPFSIEKSAPTKIGALLAVFTSLLFQFLHMS